MRHALTLAVVLIGSGCGPSSPAQPASAPLPDCEWCGADEAPEALGWDVRVPPPDEPGERLVLEGTVVGTDGATPAPGVLVYLYHTNARGVYPKRGDETGNGRRHGYLRAWLRTDAQGRYRFSTVRPGPYPGREDPAHIHVTLTPPGGEEAYVDDFLFADDPLVTPAYRARLQQRGGPGIVTLTGSAQTGWAGRRDLVLLP